MEQQLPSRKPQIPVTFGQTTPFSSSHSLSLSLSQCHKHLFFSPVITFFVLFTEEVHRPVALPHPQIGRFAPPVPQLSLDLSNCLVGRPLPRRVMDPVHHRLAVSSDFHLDPFARSWNVKNRRIQFPCFLLGTPVAFFTKCVEGRLAIFRGPMLTSSFLGGRF